MLIGITGKAGSGKDFAGEFLVNNYGFSVEKFATPLREFMEELNPEIVTDWDHAEHYNELVNTEGYEKIKSEYPEVRRLLQTLGTEVIRKIDPEFFVKEWATRTQCLGKNVVVTDVRFENEAKAIKQADGFLIRLIGCQSQNGLISDPVPNLSNHSSERGGFEVDLTIDNGHKIKEELYTQLNDAVGQFLNKN